jgi:hypothetical protein
MTMNINDNGIDREMTDTELAEYQAWQKEVAASKKAKAKAEKDNQILKEATLAKLGLTADEIAALLS